MEVKCEGCGNKKFEETKKSSEKKLEEAVSIFVCKKCGRMHNWGSLFFNYGRILIPAHICSQCKSADVYMEVLGAGDSAREVVIICKICGRINTTDGKGKMYKRNLGKEGYKEFPAYMKGGCFKLLGYD
jgi:hypothetical protein